MNKNGKTTVLELKVALPKSQKWKLTGIDKAPIFFVKNPSVVPCYVLQVYWMKLCKTRDVPGNNIITY